MHGATVSAHHETSSSYRPGICPIHLVRLAAATMLPVPSAGGASGAAAARATCAADGVGKLAAWFVLDPVVPDSNTIMSNNKNLCRHRQQDQAGEHAYQGVARRRTCACNHVGFRTLKVNILFTAMLNWLKMSSISLNTRWL